MRRMMVYILGGAVLVLSTTAFAAPTTVNVLMPDAVYNNTVSSGFNTTVPQVITWFQPFSFSPAAPDLSAYPVGGTLTLNAAITSAKLTIVANNVAAVWDIDTVQIQNPLTSTWEQLGNLKQLTSGSMGPTTTSYGWGSATGTTYSYALTGVAGIDWLANSTGFNVKVTMGPGNFNDTVSSSKLDATTAYSYDYTYDVPAPAPVVPAPCAILLASMGAGLVSWLRGRRVL